MDTPAPKPSNEETVKAILTALEAFDGTGTIIGLNCVYVVHRCDGTEEHKDCSLKSKNVGGTLIFDVDLTKVLLMATIDSARAIAEKVQQEAILRMPPTPGEKGN